MKLLIPVLVYLFLQMSCSSKFLQVSQTDKSIKHNEDYEKFIKVEEIKPEEVKVIEKTEKTKTKVKEVKKTQTLPAKKNQVKTVIKKPIDKNKKVTKKLNDQKKQNETISVTETIDKKQETSKTIRLPKYEDAEGFVGRRPMVDPFRPGEKVTLAVTYFNMAAGYLDLEVLPFKKVNGKTSYHFKITAQSSKLFAYVYKVDDFAETFVDFEDLRPYNLSVHVKESKQLKEIRAVHDWSKNEGYYWEKKITKEDGEKKKSKKWVIGPYTQNVISAAFYVRNFTLKPGKKLAFEVADEGKNIMFTGEVLRREVLETDLGPLKTIVLKPTISVDGVFKPIGEVFFWFTDDDRKMIVKIESKIRIGSIIAKLKSIRK